MPLQSLPRGTGACSRSVSAHLKALHKKSSCCPVDVAQHVSFTAPVSHGVLHSLHSHDKPHKPFLLLFTSFCAEFSEAA